MFDVFRGKDVRVIAADISEDRLEAAYSAGADKGIVWPIQATEEELIAITNKVGKMDAAFDIVGSPKTFRACFYSLNNGGTLVPIGLAGGHGVVPLPHIIGRSIAIRGNRVGDPKELRALVSLVEKEGISVTPPVELFELNKVNEALDLLRARKITGRAIFKF